jgi:hypothetical protein
MPRVASRPNDLVEPAIFLKRFDAARRLTCLGLAAFLANIIIATILAAETRRRRTSTPPSSAGGGPTFLLETFSAVKWGLFIS